MLLGAIGAAAWWDDHAQKQLAGRLGPAPGGPCAIPSTTGATSPATALSHCCTGHLLQGKQTNPQAKVPSASPAVPIPWQLAPGPVLSPQQRTGYARHSETEPRLLLCHLVPLIPDFFFLISSLFSGIQYKTIFLALSRQDVEMFFFSL